MAELTTEMQLQQRLLGDEMDLMKKGWQIGADQIDLQVGLFLSFPPFFCTCFPPPLSGGTS